MLKQILILTFFGHLYLVPGKAFAIIQQPEDKNSATVNSDLGEVNDDFQEYFFEALKQRGIENYEKANSIASGSHVCRPSCADLPIAPMNSKKQVTSSASN